MQEDNLVELKKPASDTTNDMLTEIARQGAKQMLATALELEIQAFITKHQEDNPEESTRLIRNGYLPKRAVQTGIGPIEVQVPRLRDRQSDDKIKFSSSIIPPYLRRSKSVEEFLPLLYLKGLSTGDFQDTLAPLLGENAKNLSPGVIGRLKSGWEAEYYQWTKRDLSKKIYIYWWVDGIYLQARMSDAKNCMLVVIGVNEQGQKELLALEDGFRESKESWLDLIGNLKKLGLKNGPQVASGDGALGFWAALNEAYPQTRQQRCWVHKTANVLNKLPKSLHSKAKAELHEIWMSENKKQAEIALEQFVKSYGAKYPKAADCILKDKAELLTFYDFPGERTTNSVLLS